jgi:hypothetical protein
MQFFILEGFDLGAQAALAVFFVFTVAAFKEIHFGVAFESQDMSGNPVQNQRS